MKALVLHKPGCLEMKDMPVPIPKKGELLIRTKAATICTSDINDINYNPFDIELPMIMGHEGAGIVEQIGPGVVGISVGDEIAAHPVISCGKCDSCKRGAAHLCDNMNHLGATIGGVFAEYFTIRADRVRKKPKSLSFAAASLMEPICVCVQALHRSNLHNDSNILVIGDGPFGIIMTKLLKSYRYNKLLFVGRHPFRMRFADNAITINEKETTDVLVEIFTHTEGKGIDSAILCAGSPLAVDISIAALRARGTLCIFSAIKKPTPFDLFKVHCKDLNICGSCNDSERMDEAIELLTDNSINLESIITHKMPFAEWKDAFRLAEFGKDEAVKVSLLFGGDML